MINIAVYQIQWTILNHNLSLGSSTPVTDSSSRISIYFQHDAVDLINVKCVHHQEAKIKGLAY